MSGSAAESIVCTECNEALPFPTEMLLYRPPDDADEPSYRKWNWASVLTDRIWCRSCEAPRYAERVPSLREFNTAAAVRRFPDHPRPDNVEDELLEVDDTQFRFLFTHLSSRRGRGTCLSCGGSSYAPLGIAVDRVINFKHPHCGGAFQFKRLFFNGYGPRTIRWFNVDGTLIGTQQDSF